MLVGDFVGFGKSPVFMLILSHIKVNDGFKINVNFRQVILNSPLKAEEYNACLL